MLFYIHGEKITCEKIKGRKYVMYKKKEIKSLYSHIATSN